MPFYKTSTMDVPIAIRWNLAWDKVLDNLYEEYWSITSELFQVEQFPSIKYCLQLSADPSENEDDMDRANPPPSVVLDLSIYSNEVQVTKANFTLSVPSADFSKEIESVADKTGIHFAGVHLCKENELTDPAKRLFVNDDCMVFTMNGTLSVDVREPLKPVEAVKLCKMGSKLWERDDKDFSFVVGDQEIKVHKPVVSAESPVFDRMIFAGLAETKQSKVTIVDFSYEIVKIAIKSCYGIVDKSKWKMDTAISLLQFADKYDMKDLKTTVKTFLSFNISPMNVCKIVNACVLTNSRDLQHTCLEYMLDCNRKKIAVNDLDTLDNDFVKELLQAIYSRYSL